MNSLRGKIRNFCYLNESRGSPLLMCAIALGFSEDGLFDRWAYSSMLVSEGVSGSLQSYYELVQDSDLSASAELLLRRKRLLELLVRKRILMGRLERIRLGRLSLDNMFATGIPQGDADRYYSS